MKKPIILLIAFALTACGQTAQRDFQTNLTALKKQAEKEGLQAEYTVLTALEVSIKIERKDNLAEAAKEWARNEQQKILREK